MLSSIPNRIRNWFWWLFDDYGFTLVLEQLFESFGNWVVVLQSDVCGRIRIMQDRGEISLACGPQWSPVSWNAGPWYDLDVVIRHLSEGNDWFDSAPGDSEQQIAAIAGVLRQNMEATCKLFQEDMFWRKKSELDALQQIIQDEIWERLLENDQAL